MTSSLDRLGQGKSSDVEGAAGQTPKAADGFTSPTPGPWKLKLDPPTPDYEFPYMRLSGGAGYFGNDEGDGFEISGIAKEADARLMARAPDLLARVLRLEKALREIQLDAAAVLDPENKPGYELREYAEQIHADAASALSSGDPALNEAEPAP